MLRKPSFATVTKSLVIAGFVALPAMFQNCAPNNAVQFNGSTDTSSAGTPAVTTGGGNTNSSTIGMFEAKAKFNQTATVPLDIVWVIDNSGSMTEEAAHVRANFQTFISRVSSAVDLRVALISDKGTTGEKVQLPLTGPNLKQIDSFVESKQPLMQLGASICPTGAMGACDNALLRNLPAGVRGGLTGFLRPASKKVFVVVSDDNSSLSSSAFQSIVDQVYPNQTPTVYAFTGLGRATSPCQYRENTGTAYMELAKATKGAVFNICDADWTRTFTGLANNVIMLASAPVAIPSTIQPNEIIRVEVNGKVISSSLYTISAEGLRLDSTVTASLTDATIRVYYAE